MIDDLRPDASLARCKTRGGAPALTARSGSYRSSPERISKL